MFLKLIVFCTLPTGQVQLNNSEFDSQQDQRMLELENGDFQLLADTKLREQKQKQRSILAVDTTEYKPQLS